MRPVGGEGGAADAGSRVHHRCGLVDGGCAGQGHGLALSACAGHGDGAGVGACCCGVVGHGHVHTIGCVGCGDGGGSDTVHAIVVGQLQCHIAGQVGTGHFEGGGGRLTQVGGQAQRGLRHGQGGRCGRCLLAQRHALDIAPAALAAVGVDSLHLVVEGGAGLEVAHGVILVGDARDGAGGLSTGLAGGQHVDRCGVAGINLDVAHCDVVAGRADGDLARRSAVEDKRVLGHVVGQRLSLAGRAGAHAQRGVAIVARVVALSLDLDGNLAVAGQAIAGRDKVALGDEHAGVGVGIGRGGPASAQIAGDVACDVAQIAVRGGDSAHIAQVDVGELSGSGGASLLVDLQRVAGHIGARGLVAPVGAEARAGDIAAVGSAHHRCVGLKCCSGG